jgi:hypothetical protein
MDGRPVSIFPVEIGGFLSDNGHMNRIGALFLATMALVGTVQADPTGAYSALRAAQKVASTGTLVEVKGERGEPMPQQWVILYSDPQARGGVREVVVANGSVLSQRTPLNGYSGIGAQAPIKLSRLNLDSDAVFKIANKQAQEQEIGFNWVDYKLQAESSTGSPVWVMRLFDSMGAQVGTMQVSAEDGSIVMPLQVAEVRRNEDTQQFSDSPTGQRMGGLIGKVTGTVEKSANTVKDVTLRTVGNVQEFLTGDRTIGPRDNED